MAWDKSTVTNDGVKLLSNLINGGKLTFTRVQIGSGIVDIEKLPECSDVSGIINTPAVIAGADELDGENGKKIHIQIRNDNIKESVRMRQVGLFAKTDAEPEILFTIMQNEIGEELPPYAVYPNILIEFEAVVAVSRTNNISVIFDSSLVFATVADLQKHNTSETAHENILHDVPHYKVLASRTRDLMKPDYGLGGGGDAAVVLELGEYTGNAEISVLLGEKEYDGKNISQSGASAPDNTLIITKNLLKKVNSKNEKKNRKIMEVEE